MSRFKIQHVEDSNIIEVIAMNIDNENNILIKEDDIVSIISLSEFKDMVLGTKSGESSRYRILD